MSHRASVSAGLAPRPGFGPLTSAPSPMQGQNLHFKCGLSREGTSERGGSLGKTFSGKGASRRMMKQSLVSTECQTSNLGQGEMKNTLI